MFSQIEKQEDEELRRFDFFLEQGALKLKISMKAQKKEEVDKSKCDKTRRIGAKNGKGVNSAKVNKQLLKEDHATERCL